MDKPITSGYYDVGGVSTIDYIGSKLTEEMFEGFLLGNALKYLSRCMFKEDVIGDVRKCVTYSNWLLEVLENERQKTTPSSNADRLLRIIDNMPGLSDSELKKQKERIPKEH